MARGEVAVTNYKRTNPLLVRGRDLKFSYDYATLNEFEQNLLNTDLKVYINFVDKIKFKIVFGNPHKSQALRLEIREILLDNYKVKGSSLQIDGKRLYLI